MKNLFFLLVLTTFLSCKPGVEQYKAGIESLATNWDATTASFGNFTNMLSAENGNFAKMASGMKVDDAIFSKLPVEAQAKITEAMGSFTSAGAGYGPLMETAKSFMAEWTTKGAEVTALKDGLAAGKLEGDVTTQLAGLTSFATDAGAKVTDWTSQLGTIKDAVASAQANYSTLLTELIPAEMPGK